MSSALKIPKFEMLAFVQCFLCNAVNLDDLQMEMQMQMSGFIGLSYLVFDNTYTNSKTSSILYP